MDNLGDLRKIAGIYTRLQLALGTDRMVVVGGSAMKLTCDPERQLNDIDLAVPPKFLIGVPEKRLADNGFSAEYEGDRLLVVVDRDTGIEVEVSAKTCGNLNRKLGIPPYKESDPTVIGVNMKSVIDEGKLVDVDGMSVRVPIPAHQLIMKYNLWLFRGNGEVDDQKDARDIRRIIGTYYANNGDIERSSEEISRSCKARDLATFMKDIAVIKAKK